MTEETKGWRQMNDPMITSFTVKFSDGSEFILRPGFEGDTVIGEMGHKAWYELTEWVNRQQSASVYKCSTRDKLQFLTRYL